MSIFDIFSKKSIIPNELSNFHIQDDMDSKENRIEIFYKDDGGIAGVEYYDKNDNFLGATKYETDISNEVQLFYIDFDADGKFIDNGGISRDSWNMPEILRSPDHINYDVDKKEINIEIENGIGLKYEASTSINDTFINARDFNVVEVDTETKTDIIDRFTTSGSFLEGMEFVHTGPAEIKQVNIQEHNIIDNEIKPRDAGFWASTSNDPKTSISSWVSWCKKEDYVHSDTNYVSTFNIAPDAKVLYLNSTQDLSDIAKVYPASDVHLVLYNGSSGLMPYNVDSAPSVHIDWASVRQDFDVVIVDSKDGVPPKLWDIDFSIVVFNEDIIENLESLPIEEYIEDREMTVSLNEILPQEWSPDDYLDERDGSVENDFQKTDNEAGDKEDISDDKTDNDNDYEIDDSDNETDRETDEESDEDSYDTDY